MDHPGAVSYTHLDVYKRQDEDATGGVAAGSAYVFENIAGTWTEKCKLLASDRAANDFFGFAVSIQNNVICIGAHAEDNNTKFQNGSAYIFEKVAGTWTEKSKITSSKLEHNIYFGRAVAVCGNDILSGCKEDLTSSIGSCLLYTSRCV